MAFVAADPHQHLGTVVDDGHCMRHVQVVAGVTHSSTLRRGVRVRDMIDPPRGLVIATFGGDPPRYQNRTDGSSHICVLVTKNADGSLLVVDQYQSRPGGVAERIIRDRGGEGAQVDDASCYYIVESENRVV